MAEAIVGESPSKVIELAQAKVIEVDRAAHRARLEEQRRRRYVALSRSDECGLRLVIARVEAGDAVWVDAMLNRVADLLAGRPELRPDTPAEVGRDELRSLAFGWLARPAELLTLLLEAADQPDPTPTDTESTDTGRGADTESDANSDAETTDAETADGPDAAGASTGSTGEARSSTDEEPTPAPTPEPTTDEDDADEDGEGEGAGVSRAIAVPARVLELLGRVDLSRLAPTATVYVHLHQGAVEGTTGGVARVEGLGPLLLEQVRGLLGHTNVALKPVVDLADRVSVNAYEHPETVKERVHLRTLGEVFPYGRATGRKVDMDHPVPYDPLGPPGQTGDDNAGPLSRHPAPGQDPPGVPGHPDRTDRVRLVDPARAAPPGRRARHPPPDRRGRRAPHRGPARDRRSRVGPPLGPGRRPARRAPPHRKARSRRMTGVAVLHIRLRESGHRSTFLTPSLGALRASSDG